MNIKNKKIGTKVKETVTSFPMLASPINKDFLTSLRKVP